MSIEQTERLARRLVDLFYPFVELTILDQDGRVKEIFNPISHLKEDQAFDLKLADTLSQEVLTTGKNVRCLIYPLKNKQIIGYLRLRYDLSCFTSLQEQLNVFIQGTSHPKTVDLWQESIDQITMHYLKEHQITLQAMQAKHKRELISKLQEKGLFDFKESSVYVAIKLQISRATVYNYLKTTAYFKKVHVHQVDAFTNERFGGNPAGVVLDADTLDEATMRKITRELNLSETAFVLPSEQGDFKLRYFTPTGHEITFCGHSTVGALFMIAQERRFGMAMSAKHTFDVETPCGILKMEATIDKEGEIQVAYQTPDIRLRKTELTHQTVAQAAGFDVQCVDKTFPVMYEETNQDLFIVIKSLEDLKKIECDSKALAQFSKQHGIVALCLLTQEVYDQNNHFHMRCFAPLVGIHEDPLTGSVLGGVAAYVSQFGLLPKTQHSFCVEQGHFIGRPGVVRVEFSKKQGQYQAKVFAQAVHCFSTEIHLK